MDYYHYTGDSSILATYGTKIASLLEPLFNKTVPFRPSSPPLGFVGWDDRTGAGFSNSSCVECEWDFRMIYLRALNETAIVYTREKLHLSLAAFCAHATAVLGTELRKDATDGRPWHTQLLLASAGDAVNAGLATTAEEDEIFEAVMSDPLQICQLSPFNTYWTLQALGNMGTVVRSQCRVFIPDLHHLTGTCHLSGRAEEALFVLRNCYGGMIALGATTFWETFPHAPEYISGDVPWLASSKHQPTKVPWSWSGESNFKANIPSSNRTQNEMQARRL